MRNRKCFLIVSTVATILLAADLAWSTPPISRPPYRPPTTRPPYPPGGGGSVIPIPIPIPVGPIVRPRNPNYQPNYTPADTTINPPSNVEPTANEVVEALVDPLANVSPIEATYNLTDADIQAMTVQIKGKNGKIVEAIIKALQTVLGQKGDKRLDEAVKTLRTLQTAADAGKMALADLVKLDNLIRTLLGENHEALIAIQNDFGALVFQNEFLRILATAVAGANPVPRGLDVTIILVPGMPRGAILPLGNGAVLIGTGLGARGDIIVGTGNPALAAGYGSIGPPAPETGEPRAVCAGVLIRNKNKETINYTVESSSFTITTNQTQALAKGRDWTVGFDRGGNFGVAQYSLGEGTYDFTATKDHGWELYNQGFKIKINNAQNPKDFNFVMNNQRQTVAARQFMEQTSDYPISVRFDNGRGQVRQKMLEKGEFRVALIDDQSLDLFPPNSVPKSFEPAADALPPGFKMFANPFAKKMKVAADTVAPAKSNIQLFGTEGG